MIERITYRAVPGGRHPEGGVVERTVPGQPPNVIQTFDTLADAQARADDLNAAEEAKEAQV